MEIKKYLFGNSIFFSELCKASRKIRSTLENDKLDINFQKINLTICREE